VLVSDRGGPVVGLRVELSSRVEKFTAETDKDGYAFFDNLKPGSFLLRPEFDPVWPDTVIVDVSPSGPADVTVPLTWPGRAPVTVGALKGILRGPHFYPSFGQGPFSMVLVEGISARVIETTESDGEGRFNFQSKVPPGIYFIQIKLTSTNDGRRTDDQIHGGIAVELSMAPGGEELDVDLGWSDCGLSYKQREKTPDVKVGKICGDVADTEGAAVGGAQLFLLTNGDEPKVVDQAMSDSNGKFAMKREPEGTYRLVVTRLGFEPSRLFVHIGNSNSSEQCEQPMHLRLGVL